MQEKIEELGQRQLALLWLLSTYGGGLAIQHRQRELRLTADALLGFGMVRQVPAGQFAARYELTASGQAVVRRIEAALAPLLPKDDGSG